MIRFHPNDGCASHHWQLNEASVRPTPRSWGLVGAFGWMEVQTRGGPLRWCPPTASGDGCATQPRASKQCAVVSVALSNPSSTMCIMRTGGRP